MATNSSGCTPSVRGSSQCPTGSSPSCSKPRRRQGKDYRASLFLPSPPLPGSRLLGWFPEDSSDRVFLTSRIEGVSPTLHLYFLSLVQNDLQLKRTAKKQERSTSSVYEPLMNAYVNGRFLRVMPSPRRKKSPVPLGVAVWGPHQMQRQSWMGLTEGLGEELVTWHQVCSLTGQRCN